MVVAVSGAALAGLAIAIAYDSSRFIRREYRVCSDKIKKKAKILLLSDLHNKSYGKNNEKLLAEIEKVKPDLIVAAGDMVTANERKTHFEVPAALMERLAERYPVYYGMGNHEYRIKIYRKAYGNMFEEYKEKLKTYGVRVLENERVYLPEYNIEICGLEIRRRYYKRLRREPMEAGYIESLLGKARKERFELLIGHNPDYFQQYAEWGADLTVAGHVHGGVMKLPVLGGVVSPALRLFPKYDGGMFREYGKQMVLSRGLGMHTVPVRIFNPGELVVIHLEGRKN